MQYSLAMRPALRCTHRLSALMLFVLTFVATSAETTLPRAAATDVGMSAERLENLKEVMARHLASGTSPVGIVVAIARRGHLVFLHASGVMNIESKRPLATDSIFRLMSATKVIVAAAVLTLVDEGRVRLQDPVSRYVPEFATLTVGTASGSRDRAKRAITLQDLLTHTSGLGSGASFIETMRVADVGPGTTLAEAVRRFPQAPLEFQPGDHWSYSPVAGFDTLLRVAEIVSGQPADELLRRRIFQPLAMTDTRFWTPAADTNPRLATLYDQTRDGLKPLANPGGSEKYFRRRWLDEHRRRSRAVRSDAPEWRGTERRSIAQSIDGLTDALFGRQGIRLSI